MATIMAALGSVAPSKLMIVQNQLTSSSQKNVERPSSSSVVFVYRAPIDSSSFFGERISHAPSRSISNTFKHEQRAIVARGEGWRAFTESEPAARWASGRIIFTPFGPLFTPNYGRGSNARREWEKRNMYQEETLRAQRERMRAQQEKFRQRVEGQLRNRNRTNTSTQERDMALLKELERRLKAEAERRGTNEQGEISQSSIGDLIKELEKRLRPEKGSEENPETDQSTDYEEQSGYSTVYDYMNAWLREWDQGVKKERERLQKQWEEANNEQKRSSDPDLQAKDSTAVREREQVYSPEELQRVEEAEKKKKLEDEKTSAAQGKKEDESASPSSKHTPSDGTVVYLKNESNGAELYLVGTSHVSQQSAEEVREIIRKVQPDYVMLELDRKRYDSMMKRQGGRENPFAFMQQMVQTLANGNISAMGKLVGIGLSSFYRLLATRGLQPGQEFKVAVEEAKEVGAKVVLGDQDIDITMKHLGEQMSMSDAFQFFGQPMPSDIAQKMSNASRAPGSSRADIFEQLRDRKVVRRFNEEMERGAPALTKVLLGERNEAMTKALRNLSGKVVGVVGLAHLDGIEQLWREANDKYVNKTQ